jgi:hypothetical protein
MKNLHNELHGGTAKTFYAKKASGKFVFRITASCNADVDSILALLAQITSLTHRTVKEITSELDDEIIASNGKG